MRCLRRPCSALLPVAAWLGVIALWSGSAGAHANLTGWVYDYLTRWFPGLALDPTTATEISDFLAGLRKPAHLFEYAVLALLTYRALALLTTSSRRRRLFYTLAFCAAVAGLDEFNQSLNPTRSGVAADALLDVLGAAVGLALGAGVRRWRRQRALACSPSCT